MSTRRFLFPLVGALIISGLSTLVVSRKLDRSNARLSTPRRYAAASRAMAAGSAIQADDLKFVDWPADQPLQGAFTRKEAVAGRFVIYPLAPGQPVLESYLAAPGSIAGLTTRIPPGMRAIALKSDEVIGVAGFLFPGARVDVLATYRTPGSPDSATCTVLEDAQVVAVGHQIQPDPNGKPATVNVVTILASPADAERVVLASVQGAIRFVLRNGADHSGVRPEPANLSQFTGKAARAVNGGSQVKGARPKQYVVETVLGAKATFASFN